MSAHPLEKWRTTRSTYAVNDRWIKLRVDTCITPAGHEISPFYVMEYGEWANCVIVGDDNEVTLLRHYRHGIGDYVLEFVSGNVDDGETPEEAMSRELEEETGLRGAAIFPTGVCYPNAHSHTNKVHSFIALGGTFDGHKQDELGADFIITKMPLSDLTKLIEDQDEVMQSMHLTAMFFALNFLKKHPGRA